MLYVYFCISRKLVRRSLLLELTDLALLHLLFLTTDTATCRFSVRIDSMISWRVKRQLSILIGVFVMVGGLAAFILYRATYSEPTCFDNDKNGDEIGVDCGGSCEQICRESVVAPQVVWSKIFHVSGDVYSAFTYIENQNKEAEIEITPYKMTLLDDDGEILEVRTGVTSIQANKRFGIFEGAIVLPGAVPTQVEFEFTDNFYWQKVNPDRAEVVVRTKQLTREDTSPRIDAILQNDSIYDAEDVEAVAVVYDASSQAIGASRTVVSTIPAGATAPITFTWPLPFEAGTEVCETPVDVAMAIDLSGSMDDDGTNPPQPLTSVKEAASLFVDRLKSGIDRVAVVSFANDALVPKRLSSDLSSAKNAIDALFIAEGETQNTNLLAGLTAASNELSSSQASSEADSILVVMTDGLATLPEKVGDETYPNTVAIEEAQRIKSEGVEIFTIGLGTNVDVGALSDIASSEEHFFRAFSASELESVYASVATDICRRGPRVIEIITRPVPQLF